MMGKRGFSFIEILMVVSIFTMIAGGIFQIFTLGNHVYSTELSLLDLQGHIRNAMDRMVRETRAASSATVTAVSADIDRISLTTPSASGIQYYMSGSSLVREYPSGTTRIIAGNIDRLKFTVSGSLLTIEVHATQTVRGRVFSFGLTEKVKMRNG